MSYPSSSLHSSLVSLRNASKDLCGDDDDRCFCEGGDGMFGNTLELDFEGEDDFVGDDAYSGGEVTASRCRVSWITRLVY